jgi:hypothetical protein
MATAGSQTVGWVTVGVIILMFIVVGVYFGTQSKNTVTTNAERLLSFVVLITVIISFAVGIGIIEGMYINSEDPADIVVGTQIIIGMLWPFLFLSIGLMYSVIRNFYITRDSKLFFFASFFVLLFAVLMFEVILINRQGEFDNMTAIDTSRTNTFLLAYGIVVIFLGIYSIL